MKLRGCSSVCITASGCLSLSTLIASCSQLGSQLLWSFFQSLTDTLSWVSYLTLERDVLTACMCLSGVLRKCLWAIVLFNLWVSLVGRDMAGAPGRITLRLQLICLGPLEGAESDDCPVGPEVEASSDTCFLELTTVYRVGKGCQQDWPQQPAAEWVPALMDRQLWCIQFMFQIPRVKVTCPRTGQSRGTEWNPGAPRGCGSWSGPKSLCLCNSDTTWEV